MDRKKELKRQYQQMKPQMGVFIIRSQADNQCYLEATKDLRGVMNSTLFKLRAGGHRNQNLQKAWDENDEDNFVIEILENLEYEDDSDKDYTDDLALLKTLWEEKVIADGLKLY